jgi:hypothetical protein
MKSTNEILLKMVDLADSIMSMCGGDAWERDCTADDRKEYQTLHDELDKELKRGEYSPDVIAKREADEKARANEILAGCAIDCPVCGQRLHLVSVCIWLGYMTMLNRVTTPMLYPPYTKWIGSFIIA